MSTEKGIVSVYAAKSIIIELMKWHHSQEELAKKIGISQEDLLDAINEARSDIRIVNKIVQYYFDHAEKFGNGKKNRVH